MGEPSSPPPEPARPLSRSPRPRTWPRAGSQPTRMAVPAEPAISPQRSVTDRRAERVSVQRYLPDRSPHRPEVRQSGASDPPPGILAHTPHGPRAAHPAAVSSLVKDHPRGHAPASRPAVRRSRAPVLRCHGTDVMTLVIHAHSGGGRASSPPTQPLRCTPQEREVLPRATYPTRSPPTCLSSGSRSCRPVTSDAGSQTRVPRPAPASRLPHRRSAPTRPSRSSPRRAGQWARVRDAGAAALLRARASYRAPPPGRSHPRWPRSGRLTDVDRPPHPTGTGGLLGPLPGQAGTDPTAGRCQDSPFGLSAAPRHHHRAQMIIPRAPGASSRLPHRRRTNHGRLRLRSPPRSCRQPPTAPTRVLTWSRALVPLPSRSPRVEHAAASTGRLGSLCRGAADRGSAGVRPSPAAPDPRGGRARRLARAGARVTALRHAPSPVDTPGQAAEAVMEPQPSMADLRKRSRSPSAGI